MNRCSRHQGDTPGSSDAPKNEALTGLFRVNVLFLGRHLNSPIAPIRFEKPTTTIDNPLT
jgi:hypothetical protein